MPVASYFGGLGGGRLPLQMTSLLDWVGIVLMVVFALLLAAAVFAVVRFVFLPILEADDLGTSEVADDALAVLRERFARGEIDEEEFERRAVVLRRDEE